ncbi:MAG: hypothetical protein F6K50_03680 [Moorea sp. SIO3I7]|nr:hypothetical protein [Moorena sp. SIO3I7]NEO18304.1 hypothetical protein [Moorena sp. SIO4A5]
MAGIALRAALFLISITDGIAWVQVRGLDFFAVWFGCISLKLFDTVGGTGILVEWASWWNGHLARFISGRAFRTRLEEGENEGSPKGGALRGGLCQPWLRG